MKNPDKRNPYTAQKIETNNLLRPMSGTASSSLDKKKHRPTQLNVLRYLKEEEYYRYSFEAVKSFIF